MLNIHPNRLRHTFALLLLAFVWLMNKSAMAASQTPQPEQAENKTPLTLPKCAYIASYAPGYNWQDRLQSALEKTLDGHCELQTFYMDSKKLNTEHQLEKAGLKAKKFIESHTPDLVIISDDNALEYLLAPYFRNSNTPFVFCGINNSGTNYGLPYGNTTGMLEVSPIRQLLELLFQITPGKTNVAYLTGPGTTSNKNVAEFHRIVKQLGISSSTFRAKTQEDWRQLFRQLQQDKHTDIILFENFASFPEWDETINLKWVQKYTKKLTITHQDWVMPYVALGLTKKPEEQGRWAALTAIQILQETPISQLETVANNEFIFWYNPVLIKHLTAPLPNSFLIQAHSYQSKELSLDR